MYEHLIGKLVRLDDGVGRIVDANYCGIVTVDCGWFTLRGWWFFWELVEDEQG